MTPSQHAKELEGTRPFGALVDALDCSASSSDPRRVAIAELLSPHIGAHGVVTVTSDPGLQFHVADAFVDLAEELALRSPLVVAVDDVQWADPSSLLTLDALCRRLTYVPVALILCLRPAPRSEHLARLVETLVAAGGHPLTLDRLDEGIVAELASDIADAVPGPTLLAGLAAANGNPLFVTELLAALVEEAAIETVDGRAELTQMNLPPSLRLTILGRLSFLSTETLELLRGASILGESFSLAELSTVTDRSAFAMSSALDEAFSYGVLIDDGDRIRFRHGLVRGAVYYDIAASARAGLHREAG